MKKLIFDEQLVITQYYALRNAKDVAKIYGCSDQTILRVLARNGVDRVGWKVIKREPSQHYKPIDEDEVQRIADAYREYQHIGKVATVTHHAQETVSKIVRKEFGLDRERLCGVCGKPFVSTRIEQKWCSRNCRNRANPGDDRKRCRRYGVYFDPKIRREDVFKRDDSICQICGIKCDPDDLSWGSNGPTHPTIDHIVPLSKGGTHTWNNVQCACGQCNSVKRDIIDYAYT